MEKKSSKTDGFVYGECHSAWFGILKSTQGFTKNKTFSEKERFIIFICKLDFIKEIEKIREVFGIHKYGFSVEDEAEKWIEKIDKKTHEKQKERIKKLLINFKIHPRWEECIKYFLLFNRDDIDHILPAKIDCRIEWDEEYNLIRTKIEIYSDTKLSHIQKDKKIIEKLTRVAGYSDKITSLKDAVMILTKNGVHFKKPKEHPKFRNYKEFKQHKKIFELNKEKLSYGDIAKEMGWMRSDENKVSTYLFRFRKTLDKASLS